MKKIEFDKGLSINKVEEISHIKAEPDWMKNFRLKSYKSFEEFDLPSFGPKIDIDFNDITYSYKME